MGEQIKLVIIDLDGTVLDTREFLYQGFEHTIKVYSLPQKTRAELDHVISVTKYLPEAYALLGVRHNVEEVIKTLLDFRSKHLQLVKAFPGVIETLKSMHASGIIIAALTNRLKHLHETLEVAGVKQLIDLLVTKNDIANPKPHPGGVEKILSHFSIARKQALIVGDTDADIVCGKNAGIKTVGVTYGFGSATIKESKPDYLISDFPELIQLECLR